jgi:flagellar biosynthesis protein FliQ
MDMFEQLLLYIMLAITLIVYYSMFGSVVTAITGAVANWSNVNGSNLAWLPSILIILAAIMPMLGIFLLIWAQFKHKGK